MSEVIKPNPNRRVLIVEDSSKLFNLLPRLYEDEGIQAVAVCSLEDAKKALEAGGFTEVLTDSLKGDWIGVVESAGNLPVRLLSANASIRSEAERRSVQFLDKGDFNIRDILQEPIVSKEQKR